MTRLTSASLALIGRGPVARLRASTISDSSCCKLCSLFCVLPCRNARCQSCLDACNTPEGGPDGHADAGCVTLAEHVASHHFACDKQIWTGLAAKVYGGLFVDLQPQGSKSDSGLECVRMERRRVDRLRPMS